MPKITVIITTYKGSNYLRRAIDSVLNQTYSDFEIIVVDDNDPTNDERKKTELIMSEYKNYKSIIYLKHEKNKNGAAARNTGIRIAKGKYIAFLDDDDFYMPERLEKCLKKLEESNCGAVYTSVAFLNKGKITKVKEANKSGDLFVDLLLDETLLGTGSNLFIKREDVMAIGGFDERYERNQDYEFMLRFFELSTIKNIDDILVVKAKNGTSNIPGFNVMLETKKMILNRFTEQINKLEDTQKRLFQFNIFTSLLNSAFIHLNYDDIKTAEKIGKEWGFSLNIKNRIRKYLALCHLYKSIIRFKLFFQYNKEIPIADSSQKDYIQNVLRKY